MDRDASILVVDDDASSRLALCALLQDEGYEVETASNGASALRHIRDGKIDLVVSDVQMPGMDGFAIVRNIRRNSKTRDIPVILVSGQANPDRRTAGLHIGADDFMAKPLNFAELLARVETQLRHRERNQELLKEVVRDPLTNTLNRRGILEVLAQELKQAATRQGHTSLLMIDLNNFKMVNDTRGHAAGDEVLRQVASSLANTLRTGDYLGRLGGDEFLIVLAQTNYGEARVLAERLRQNTDAASLAIGVASAQGAELADVLIRRADQAMYLDKASSREPTRSAG